MPGRLWRSSSSATSHSMPAACPPPRGRTRRHNREGLPRLRPNLKDYAAAVASDVLASDQVAARVRRAIQIPCRTDDHAAKKGSVSVIAVKGMQYSLRP